MIHRWLSNGRPRVWTDELWAEVKALHAQGWKAGRIAEKVGVVTTRQVLDKIANDGRVEALRLHHEREQRWRDERQAERDAALAHPRTVTQQLCGDPLPGRSALDKRGVRA